MSGAPLISVVVETITARADCTSGDLPEDVERTLAALERLDWPRAAIEPILVVDEAVRAEDRAALERRWPRARIVESAASNYFAAKNAGARAASGAWIALLDGDCAPDPAWLGALMAKTAPGVAAVAGRTRYTGLTRAERIFSIPDFAYVLDEGGGAASGFNINNVLFRREALVDHPFDERIPRNGGCFELYHRLRRAGLGVRYAADAVVWHGDDVSGLRFIGKHFDRGRDSVGIRRMDGTALLRGTRWFRRLGPLALAGFAARQTLLDAARLARHRRQIGIAAWSVPFYAAVAAMLRAIELAGALTGWAADGARPAPAPAPAAPAPAARPDPAPARAPAPRP